MDDSSEQLFRHESGRLITALTRIFGFENLALAEDVVQDTFCRALEVWKLRGVPENPRAWLMKAAKNRAIDLLRRERTARRIEPELTRLLESEWTMVPTVNAMFAAETIKDDQLRMMFTCCDPRIPEEGQLALTLNLLAGFTSAEIASSFLTKTATIEKRIERAKKALAENKQLFDLSDDALPARLSAVHRALYLLFNEGYHGTSKKCAVRFELCREAMRLAALLLDNPLVSSHATYALCALMWLHAARLRARVNGQGELIRLADQDRAQWDTELMARGNEFLELSASGPDLSEYHLEAAIASIHSSAPNTNDTDWPRIVWLYDMLLKIRPSPVVALNRAIAVGHMSGPERGIEAITAIEEIDRLASYPFFQAALGEMTLRAGRAASACRHFEAAALLARSPMERRYLQSRAEEARGDG